MSKAAPIPVQDYAGAGPAAGDGVPLTPAEVIRRGMEDGGRRIKRYEVDFDSGECRIVYAMDTAAQLSDLARDILEAIGETPDSWVSGEEVCRRVGDGVTIGRTYYRAVAELRDSGRVETNTKLGIRLKS